MPYELARTDINFLHNILELCFYFLPIKSNASSIFDLVLHLFTTEEELSKSSKKILLCRFFGLLGMHPEELPFEDQRFIKICQQPLNHEIFKIILDEESHVVVQSWLLRCIDLHPEKNRFKTFFQSPNRRT
jgi:hypothetical protein